MYHDILKQIRSASGSTKKVSLLASAKDDLILRTIIQYAYDPFMHFYVTKTSKDGCGTCTILSAYDACIGFLNACHNRRISGDQAKQSLEALRKILTKEDFDIIKLILKKDLRFGMAIKSINQAWPGFITDFGVMLASSFENLTKPMYMSLKIDGLRGRLKGTFFTRNGHKIHGLDHLLDQIPEHFRHLDGELKIDGIDFDSGSGQIRSHGPVTSCKYNVFDLPDYIGPFKKRYELLQEIIPQCGPDIILVKHVLVSNQEKV